MPDEKAAQTEPIPPETSYTEETKRDALDVLFPDPKEIRSRIPLITRLGGRAVEIRKLIRANAEYEIRRSIAEGRDIDWEKIDPIQRFLDLSVSLGAGKGRAEAVTIAKNEPMAEPRRGFWDLFRPRRSQ